MLVSMKYFVLVMVVTITITITITASVTVFSELAKATDAVYFSSVFFRALSRVCG